MQTDGDPWIFDFDNHYYESPDGGSPDDDVRRIGRENVVELLGLGDG